MNKNAKKLISLLLCAAMAVSLLLAGCGNSGTSSTGNSGTTASSGASGETQNAGNLTTISASYSAMGTVSADSVPRLQKILAEDLGIELDVWLSANAEAEINNMLAGGEYPDLLMWYEKEKILIAAENGQLVDLAQYKDQLPAIFDNPVMQAAIQRSKDEVGNGEQVFFLPTRVGKQTGIYAFSPSLRFDVYQDIGAPEITDWDTFLDVLEQMQKAYPETEEGLKTYALSMAGADLFYFWEQVVNVRGAMDDNYIVLVDHDLERIRSIFDDDSELLAAIQFMFDANQRGILDPDGATQNGEDYTSKVSNGQIMYTPFNWWGTYNYNTDDRINAEDPSGYAQVWPACFQLPAFPDNICGNNRSVALTTSCEDLDAALKYLNWLYSDGLDLILNDEEGFLYTENADGTRVPTQTYLEYEYSATNEDGSTYSDLYNALGGDPMITGETTNPLTGTTYSISEQDAFQVEGPISNLEKEWREWNGGYDDLWDKYKDTDMVCQLSNGFFLKGAMEQKYQDMYTNMVSLLQPTVVQMVYAKDQAEFDSIWAQFKSDCEALGYEDYFNYARDFYTSVKSLSDKYMALVDFG